MNIKSEEEKGVIGQSCCIYKVCKICGVLKWYKSFPAKGRSRRRTHCRRCQKSTQRLRNSLFSQYTYDTSILRNADIKVRLKVPYRKKRIEYKVSYQQAVQMVEEGMAGIVHEKLIHKYYNEKTFKTLILQRDNRKCYLCGKYGDTIDHIIPKSKGGISSFQNCCCACEDCNRSKGNLSLERYLYYIRNFREASYH